MKMCENNYFYELNKINVSDKTEKKNGLTYLSWAYAWGEVKKRHADANYKIYETAEGCCYWTDGRTCWVKVGVTVNGIEHVEYLPIMNNSNRSIPLESVTSFDANKAIQRALTKACARHGLGLYVYAGEDLPEEEKAANLPTKEQLAKLQELGGTIQICATYFKKDIEDVTADDVQALIDKKEKANAKKATAAKKAEVQNAD